MCLFLRWQCILFERAVFPKEALSVVIISKFVDRKNFEFEFIKRDIKDGFHVKKTLFDLVIMLLHIILVLTNIQSTDVFYRETQTRLWLHPWVVMFRFIISSKSKSSLIFRTSLISLILETRRLLSYCRIVVDNTYRTVYIYQLELARLHVECKFWFDQ